MGIPVSLSLKPAIEAENIKAKITPDKKRLLYISFLAVLIAVFVSFIAKLLIYLIDFITNVSFFGTFSLEENVPAENNLGLWVILIPAIGGVIIGFMALYGSKAIRGHGIPEAMEQILTNKSKIRPAITYLKPLSSAISIGTGGPFGAEGPIIATGGALGSTLGQMTKITNKERKILLAAGATAGMAAIFGSPIAAIFLAIELLLFEFSPKSLIPVALACITGAAGHHFLFEEGPVFPMQSIVGAPSTTAVFFYSLLGIAMGLISVFTTKLLFIIEDAFEKLPIHWMWWPAIGGLFVGLIGYFAPRTLGVGYYNITELLSGEMALSVVASLCFFKFISWAIALGSGTSGGTLAPLLTIGGAVGVLLGHLIIAFFPESDIHIAVASLVGMSAMFAGASRALLTSIIFAVETTGQSNTLLPLLAGCAASYFISFFIMENTIMTEKIARRGVKTPDSYEPDILGMTTVKNVIKENSLVISENNSLKEVRDWLAKEEEYTNNFFVVTSREGEYRGFISLATIFSSYHSPDKKIGDLTKNKNGNAVVDIDTTLHKAVQIMTKEKLDVLPVVSNSSNNIVGIITHQDVIDAYRKDMDDNETKQADISMKKRSFRILLKGHKILTKWKNQ